MISLENVTDSFFFAQHSFYSIETTSIKNHDGLEFFPFLFDYIRHKYDHDKEGHHKHAAAAMPYDSISFLQQ